MDPPVAVSRLAPTDTADSDRRVDLAKFPPEILLMLPLRQSSLASMILVCKHYHRTLTPQLYQWVRCRSTEEERGQVPSERYKPHVLMKTLLSHPPLATRVRGLFLEKSVWSGTPDECDYLEPWWRDGIKLLKNLPNLKYLTIDLSWSFLLLIEPHMPKLKCVTIIDCGERILSPSFAAQLAQPCLTTLVLKKEQSNAIRNSFCHPFNLGRQMEYRAQYPGQEIILDRVKLGSRVLKRYVKACSKGLRSFIWVWADDCPHKDYEDLYVTPEEDVTACNMLLTAELLPPLRTAVATLESLVLMHEKGRSCPFDGTILPSLTPFTTLRNLRIDATMLLGRRRCEEYWRSAPD